MGDRLAWLVRRDGYRISTGFVGTAIVQDALTRTGHTAAAARLLLQTECPSWLYPVTMGATTIWERWDSMLEDGSINPGEMTSFNHYAFGSVADWLHRVVAGLAPLEPGYRRIAIAPRPLPGLEWASTRHETPYGEASVGWQAADGGLIVTALVPPNATAEVRLPGGGDPLEVGSGRHEWFVADDRAVLQPAMVSLASSLAEIIDDPEAYEAVGRVLDSSDDKLAREFRRNTSWVEYQHLGGRLARMFVAPSVMAMVEEELARLTERRKSGSA